MDEVDTIFKVLADPPVVNGIPQTGTPLHDLHKALLHADIMLTDEQREIVRGMARRGHFEQTEMAARVLWADLIYRLRKRAEIRRQITTRKSVQEGKPDRIADLLEEAAFALQNGVCVELEDE